jgi:hypothetical protein
MLALQKDVSVIRAGLDSITKDDGITKAVRDFSAIRASLDGIMKDDAITKALNGLASIHTGVCSLTNID